MFRGPDNLDDVTLEKILAADVAFDRAVEECTIAVVDAGIDLLRMPFVSPPIKALNQRFDSKPTERIVLARQIKKYFANHSRLRYRRDRESVTRLDAPIDDTLMLTIGFDRSCGRMGGKMFQLRFGVEPQSGPLVGGWWSEDIMLLNRIWSGPVWWYATTDDLDTIFNSIRGMFETVIPKLVDAFRRHLSPLPEAVGDDIEDRGPLTMRQAMRIAQVAVADFENAAGLHPHVANCNTRSDVATRSLSDAQFDGSLRRHEMYSFGFSSESFDRGVFVDVPRVGPLRIQRFQSEIMDYRQPRFPREWIDSDEVLAHVERPMREEFGLEPTDYRSRLINLTLNGWHVRVIPIDEQGPVGHVELTLDPRDGAVLRADATNRRGLRP